MFLDVYEGFLGFLKFLTTNLGFLRVVGVVDD